MIDLSLIFRQPWLCENGWLWILQAHGGEGNSILLNQEHILKSADKRGGILGGIFIKLCNPIWQYLLIWVPNGSN